MASIKILNKDNLQNQIRKAIDRKMDKIMQGAKELLEEQARVYRDKFANSQEYQNIKDKMRGEFGFTDEEVAGLDRILELMVPSNNDVTVSFFDNKGNIMLEWVDYNKLRDHPFAQHDLTRLNKDGSVIGITDTVSWIEWLENGETITGYQFFRPNAANLGFSRSGEGLMRVANGIFILEPTRIFEKIANDANVDVLRRGFGLLVKRFGKE